MNGIIIASGDGVKKNIGDYIQSIAAEQFVGSKYCYVEREKLNDFVSVEKVKTIMNGWFMWNPSNFPPSRCIEPLFISFHITPSIASTFFTEKTIVYLKQHEPIGCRDINTMHMLQEQGIKAYFSSCLTLTLGIRYAKTENNGKTYFVDPYFEITKGRIQKFYLVLKHFTAAIKLNSKLLVKKDGGRLSKHFPFFGRLIAAASFYDVYSTVFSKDLLLNALFVSHSVYQADFLDDDDKMAYAKKLIIDYARANLIITSRIHCALPALGIGTPVIFVDSESLETGRLRPSGRLDGLINLMHTIYWTGTGFKIQSKAIREYMEKNGRVDRKCKLINPSAFEEYRDLLIKRVTTFFSS